MTVLTAVFLTAKGDVRKVQLKEAILTTEAVTALFKKKTKPKQIGTYEYGSVILTLFGYLEGRAGTENKHELPPPNDHLACFGDILVIASKSSTSWETPISFTPEQYETFYQRQFGGSEESDEEADSDNEEMELDTKDIAEELEEAILAGVKKKKTAIEGDDGEEAEEELEEEEEIEEEEEVEEDVEEEGEGDGEHPIPVKATKSKSKKKTAKVNLTVQSNTYRAKQHTLQNRPGFKEMVVESNRDIPDEEDHPLENTIRRSIVRGFTKILGSYFTEDQCISLEQIVLEKSFNEADKKAVIKHFDNPLFRVVYESVARRVCSNLDPKSYVGNESLLKKIQSGDLSFDHLKSMGVQDLNPGLYTELRDRLLLREQNLLEGNKSMATDLFECNRCHKRQCTFYELQTRSADEPMTKFITCLNCNKRWRQ